MLLLIVSLIIFLALHSIRIFAPSIRECGIAKFGKGGWHAGYGIASLVSLLFIAYAFGEARNVTDVLYTPPTGMAHLTSTLMLIALVCAVSAVLPAGYIATKLKYPFIVAIKIWAISHIIANGEVASLLVFVAFLAWAVLLRISMKKREALGEYQRRAFVSGRYDIVAICLGIVLWGLIIMRLHVLIIGVPVLAM